MASTITAGNATNGLALSCDNTGILELKTGTGSGTTAVTIGTGQQVAVTLGSAAAPSITFSGDTNTGIFSPAADTIAFAEGGAEVGRFDSSGNLLVAKTTGTSAGINSGSIQGGKEIMSCGSTAGIAWENRSGGVTSNSNWYMWYNSGGTNFLYNGAANIVSINGSTGVYTALSDADKKKDFEPSTVGLQAILRLKPTLYRMKDAEENSDKELGFIAQDVKDFIPQAYVETNSEDANGQPYTFIGLQDRPILAALTKAIQEQQAMIEELKAKVAALEGAA
jgi:hypothetical protein